MAEKAVQIAATLFKHPTFRDASSKATVQAVCPYSKIIPGVPRKDGERPSTLASASPARGSEPQKLVKWTRPKARRACIT